MASPPSFQFYPRDFVSSRSVRMMTPEQRGGYIMLLCHAWMSDECGELPGDDATLAQLSELGDRWPACREAILRAFDQGSQDRPPVIIQRRMRQERDQQIGYQRAASEGGKARMRNMPADARAMLAKHAANSRWHKDESQRIPADASTASASASASASAESKNKPPCRWRDAFGEFWHAYPHRKGRSHRKPALAAWDAITPKTPEMLAKILDGLALARQSPDWTREGGQFVEAAERWLKRAGWDSSDGSTGSSGAVRPREGERRGELVWWQGAWRSLDTAQFMGYEAKAARS